MSFRLLFAILIFALATVILASSEDYQPLSLKQNNEIDTLIRSLIKNTLFFKINEISSDNSCGFCKTSVDYIRQEVLKKYGVQGLYKFLETICPLFMDGEVCIGAINHYGDIVLDSIINRAISPERVCSSIKLCNALPFINIDEYAKRILSTKPEKIKTKINKDTPELKVVQISDIHLDLEYKEGALIECSQPLCCHDKPTEENPQEKLSGFYGAIGNCDGTIEVVKTFAAKMMEIKPDFIMFTGDNIAHDVWKVKQQEVVDATKASIDAIVNKIGYDIPIYPALGNHEKAPVDEFHGEEKELLEGLAEIFKPFLTEEAYESFKKYGYYTQLHKNTKLRIVSLNCILCDSFNWYLIYDTTQTKKMYDWLENVLSEAEKNNETVHIMDHIPMNSFQHNIQCGLRLKVLLDRYQNIIKGYYSGHTHSESLGLVYEYNSTNPIHINYISSGLTTYSQYNPSFRVYLIDSENYALRDFIQYRFNLTESNKLRQPVWFVSYIASKLFNVTDLTDIDGLSKINIEGDYIIKKYTDTDEGKKNAFDKDSVSSNTCNFKSDTMEDVMKCKDIKPGFTSDYLYYVLNRIGGDWIEDE